MKKHLLILAMSLLIGSTVFAQEKAFQFGFKIAPSMSWLKPTTTDYVNEGVKIGFNWGFVGDIYLMENYSVQTGFNVLYVNGSYSYPDLQTVENLDREGITERDIRLKYIQIPAVLRMRTNENNRLSFYAEAGLGIAFKTGAKADDYFRANEGGFTETKEDLHVSKEYALTRESLILGGGVFYNLGGSTRLFGGLRFDNNFIDILKYTNKVQQDVKNNGIANFIELNIGVLL